MSKQSPKKDISIVQPQPIKGSVSITGKKVVVGSVVASEGSSKSEVIKGLKEASKKEIFPQPTIQSSLNG